MPIDDIIMNTGKYIRTPEIREKIRQSQLNRNPNTVPRGDKHVNYMHDKNHNCTDCGKKLRNVKSLRCWGCYKKYAVGENSPIYKDGGFVLVSCTNCGKEHKKERSEHNRMDHHFCSLDCRSTWVSLNKRGVNSHNYKNGKTTLYVGIRLSMNSRKWRKDVFNRDSYVCQDCGDKCVKGHAVYLEAHHIKEFAQIIADNHIKSFEDALQCNEMWDIDNGITLCRTCHDKTKKGNVIKMEMVCQ